MTIRFIVAGGQAHPEDSSGTRPRTLVNEEWSGDGPPVLHLHEVDDEAWHALEGSLTCQFSDREVGASAGTTVLVPAGQAHTCRETQGPGRYLIIMTPHLARLVAALHASAGRDVNEIMARYASRIVGSEPSGLLQAGGLTFPGPARTIRP